VLNVLKKKYFAAKETIIYSLKPAVRKLLLFFFNLADKYQPVFFEVAENFCYLIISFAMTR